MGAHLSMADITSYQKLISMVSKLEKMTWEPLVPASKPRRDFTKKAESKAAWVPS